VIPNPPSLLRRAKRAFTLLEIVLALAVTALLLSGASFFLYSLSSIWLKADTEPTLDQHYRGACRFLEYLILQAKTSSSTSTTSTTSSTTTTSTSTTSTSSSASSSSTSSTSAANVSWGFPPNESTAGTPMMQISLADPLPFFVWDEGPLPNITCWLMLDDKEGLYAVWKSEKESKENPSEIYRTPISKLVTGITYLYYDDSTMLWQEDPLPPSETMTSGTVKGVSFTFNLNGDIRTYKIYFRKKPTSLPLVY